MKRETCDVAVVGAGPAGSAAALGAARAGARVILIERRSRVGLPVRCAEYIPGPLLGELGMGRDFVVQPVTGMKTFLHGHELQHTRAPGWMICRDRFDQCLSDRAQAAGAVLRLGTRALGLEGSHLILRSGASEILSLKAEMIIGADGPHSRVGRWIGAINTHLIPGIQARVPLVEERSFTEVHFLENIRGGYGWVFPKGAEANVGLGMIPGPGRPSLRTTLEGFLSWLGGRGTVVPQPKAWSAGWIPAGPLGPMTRHSVILAGDAAGQTHPITGAGVAQAVMGGRMAGRWAAEAPGRSDPARSCAEYEEEWADTFGESHERAWKRRQVLEREWSRLDQILRSCWVAFREYYAAP